MSRPNLARFAILAAYLGVAGWATANAYWIISSSYLLVSLTLDLALFIVGIGAKRGELVLYSWIWLAGNAMVVLALVPGVSFLTIIAMSILLYMTIDFFQFLEIVSPLGSVAKGGGFPEAAGWTTLKTHMVTVSAIAFFTGVAVWAGVALASPMFIAQNPMLAIGAIATVLVALLAVLVRTPPANGLSTG